ncbi:MAG TPA: asparagine synthase-related protein [Anaerolineales bacterium]|nr:asparagine synthase-related protein [Anaerolineales bacterium]
MPGLIGFVKPGSTSAAGQLLEQMAAALEPDPRFRRELHSGEGFGLGRVSLAILSPGPQPVWSDDRKVCLFMEGEVFDAAELRRALGDGGHDLRSEDDAELALHLYLEYGKEFASRLNGAFIVALWDFRRRELIVTNDRLGLYPVYHASTSRGFFFASGVRGLLAERSLPRRIDRIAMAEFLTFDHVLGQRTLIEDARLLPQASVLVCRQGGVSIRKYWEPISPSSYPIRKDIAYSDELIDIFRRAVRRQSPNGQQAAILLSGGMDSRAILAAMAEGPGNGHLSAVTWGIPGCDDERFAGEVARLAAIPHHALPLRPDWMRSLAETGVRLTDGMGNLVNLHGLAVAEDSRRLAPVLYKGFLGDAMFGFGMRPRYWADYDEASRLHVHLEAYRDYNVLTFDLPDHQTLFTDAFRKRVGEGLLDDYRAAMRASRSPQLSDQRLYIDYTQRVPRMTINGVEVVRQYAAVRLPYADNELMDFSLRVPPGLRMGRQVMIQAFVRAYPSYAQIPVTPSGVPMMACARDLLVRGGAWARWHLRRVGLGRLAGPDSRPAKDYDGWFRTVLRDWVEETLLSPANLNRGYFKPGAVRQLVQEHMAGADHAVRLGALLSLELWHRQFVD